MTDLRTLRKHLGWTQQRLADALGVTRETICEHENHPDLRPVPRERMLAVLCLCLWAILQEEKRKTPT